MTESKFSVPTSETGITKRWLSIALAESFPDATFTSLETERIGEAYGFASRLYRFKWKEDKTPQSVILKFWDTSKKAGIGEVLFYTTFKDVGIRVPKCFYSKIDEELDRGILVLEDLTDCIQGDVLEPVNLERATEVAQSLARLHATWLEHPKLTELTWLADVSIWTPEREWIKDRRKLFLKRFPNHLNNTARLLLDKLEFAPDIARKRLEDVPTTLLHGDFHLDNIVFENQIEPVFLDWSRPVKGGCGFNLAQVLFQMAPLEHFDFVFDSYLCEFNKLSHSLQNRIGLEKQIGGELLRLFSMVTCGGALWQPSLPRAKKILESDIKALNEIMDFWQERDPELFSMLS